MPVRFIPDGHKYENEKGERYISVTTLIGKYKAPFDSEYWSLYKAIKLVLERAGTWVAYKKKCGGWDKVVEYYKSHSHPKDHEIQEVKKRFLHNWSATGQVAREVGTDYHQLMENELEQKKQVSYQGRSHSFSNNLDILAVQDFKDDKVYAELLIYNDEFKIAGTADKVVKTGKVVSIYDYKTSREIEYESFQDTRLKTPLTHIPACNFYEYSLQLSMYAWMMEQRGYEIDKLAIEHVPDNHKLHPVSYVKEDVIKLLQHYARHKETSPGKVLPTWKA